MPSGNWNKDIKGVPQIKGVNSGSLPLQRFLTLSSADTESGVNSARKNIKGYQ